VERSTAARLPARPSLVRLAGPIHECPLRERIVYRKSVPTCPGCPFFFLHARLATIFSLLLPILPLLSTPLPWCLISHQSGHIAGHLDHRTAQLTFWPIRPPPPSPPTPSSPPLYAQSPHHPAPHNRLKPPSQLIRCCLCMLYKSARVALVVHHDIAPHSSPSILSVQASRPTSPA
jgi:hypothetical protein